MSGHCFDRPCMVVWWRLSSQSVWKKRASSPVALGERSKKGLWFILGYACEPKHCLGMHSGQLGTHIFFSFESVTLSPESNGMDERQTLKGTGSGKVEDNKFTLLLLLFVYSFLSNSIIINLVQILLLISWQLLVSVEFILNTLQHSTYIIVIPLLTTILILEWSTSWLGIQGSH